MKYCFYYNLDDIHEAVYRKTSYIANNRRGENGALPESLIVHRQDDILFKDLFDVAASDIFDTLSAYSKSRSNDAVESELYDNTKWSVFMDMPDSFNTNQLRPIDAEIKNALINNIISRWALIAIPNESEIYNSLYEKNLSNIRFKLSARNKPIIRPFTRFP